MCTDVSISCTKPHKRLTSVLDVLECSKGLGDPTLLNKRFINISAQMKFVTAQTSANVAD